MNFNEIVEDMLFNLYEFDSAEYSLVENAFIRKRKWEFFDFIIYILTNTGKTSVEEIDDFITKLGWDKDKIISKQDLSKQRKLINPKIFKDMNYKFIGNILKSEDYVPSFKDFIILLGDGSKAEIPNLRTTKDEFDVAPDTEKYTQPARTLFSTIVEAKHGFVIDSILAKSRSSERELLKEHLKNIQGHVDFSKCIIILDRGYYSLELMLFFDSIGLNYIFRLRKDVYIDEREGMGEDEYLNIELKNNRIQNFKDDKLLEKIQNKDYFKRRFVNIELKTKEIETLLTNLTPEIASKEELNELYKIRWEIEVNYDKMKNKLRIEEFAGRTEIIIQQDFYAKIFIYNLYVAISAKSKEKLEETNKGMRENEDKEKRPNSNLLIGRIKKRLLELIMAPIGKLKEIINDLIDFGSVFTIDHYFNRKIVPREKKSYTNKFKTNLKRSF